MAAELNVAVAGLGFEFMVDADPHAFPMIPLLDLVSAAIEWNYSYSYNYSL